MKTKIQIKTMCGSVLFEHEAKDNTTKNTVERAVNEGAYLRGADLIGAALRDADLTGAYLRDAALRDADLTGADLTGAYLRGAALTGTYLKKIQPHFNILPEEGSFIGWKKCASGCLVKLEIPPKAKRHNHLSGRKCRASYVKTLQVWDSKGNEIKECRGSHDPNMVYKVGRLTRPDKYDPNPLVDCSNGIHFFISKQEAIDW